MKNYYVYKITNLVNGKIYIGQTSRPDKRWWQHCYTAKTGKQGDHNRFQYVHRAIRKYGEANFSFEIIGIYDSIFECKKYEIEFIRQFDSKNRNKGYNLTVGGDGAVGYKHSNKSKKIMRLLKEGKYDGEKNPFYGRKHSQQSKTKISISAKLKIGPKNSFWGKKHNEKSLNLMRQNHQNKARYLTDQQLYEVRKKYSTGNYSYSKLSNEYNIDKATIRKIILYIGPYSMDKRNEFNVPDKTLKRLSIETCNKLRLDYSSGKHTQNQLAGKYGISLSTTNAVVNFRGTYAND